MENINNEDFIIFKENVKKYIIFDDDIKKIEKIVKEKKAEKKKPTPPPAPKIALQIGYRVRLKDGKAVGSIDAIEKNKAIVNYGMFTTNVSLDQLEFVSKS